jgi:competence protein ComEA
MNFVLMLTLMQSLPDGPGKAVTERMCKPCHGLDNVVRARRTEDKWAEVVDDMVSRGAKGTDDEVDQVIKYLSLHFGPKVNVNKASASDLKESLGISASDADAIVQYRTEKGTFKSIQDLMKVPGIDAKKIEGLQDRLEF